LIRAPDGFLIGTATSAHQVEGGNTNSDWWWFEHQPGTPCRDRSGDACDFYHRYPEDLELMARLGFNAFRFSIEWARIEPAEGEFSTAALDHYRRLLAACHQRGLTPLVTFHHFTLPRWVMELGGFPSPRFPELFARYCDRSAAALGDLLGYACTINEPEGWGEGGYLLGINPPGHRGDLDGMLRTGENALRAHRAGAEAIRAHSRAPVGVTLALPDLQYEDGARPGDHPVELNSRLSDQFLEAARDDDFVGVQTYTRVRFGPEGLRGPYVAWDSPEAGRTESESTTQMGYEVYPSALGNTIRRAWGATGGTRVLVTENGIATEDDSKRLRFIEAALGEVQACLEEGIDVGAYLYWTFLDSFEWALGYGPKFGLVECDRQTFERRPKPGAAWLGQVARALSASGSSASA
jgi:beta-glucosidase